MLDENELYIVVDIEADGPVPELYSMLSLGAVATSPNQEVSSFYRTLLPYEKASQDPSTMEWWKNQPEAWKEVTTNTENPQQAMNDFNDWVKSLGKTAVFVANPVALDYTFVAWYLEKFTGENPFRNDKNVNRTLDLRSFIAGKLDLSLTQARRVNLPKSLTIGMPKHTHNAMEDARGYAVMLRNVLEAKTS